MRGFWSSTPHHSIPFRKSPAPAAARPRVFLAPLLRFAPKRSWQCGFVREKHRRLAGVLDKSAATRGKAPKARKAGLSHFPLLLSLLHCSIHSLVDVFLRQLLFVA
jgi:hypothetical protein